MILIFLASGRAGEAATATWNLSVWDDVLDNLHFCWSQSKTGKQKGVTFVSDHDSYEMDFYHSLGCYFICKYGQENHNRPESENHWILPDLANQGTASSRKISAFLQDLSPTSKNMEFKRSIVPRLPEDVSGNSLRVGSINEAVAKNVPVQSVILHGGHEMQGYSASWEYVVASPAATLPG